MTKFNITAAKIRSKEIQARLGELRDILKERELNEAENIEYNDLMREAKSLMAEAALADMPDFEREVKMNKNQMLREAIRGAKQGKSREVTLGIINEGDTNNITSSGAVALTINDILPNLEKGLIWGSVGMKVQTGVKGNILWPYSTSSVEVEEVGETVALTDKDIDFDKINAVPYRSGITIAVSNEAIDDAEFDLLAYIQTQMTLAVQRYLNKKTFSFANFTGLKGPFAGKTKQTAMNLSYSALKAGKAAIAATGVKMDGFAYVVSAAGRALLETTPKDAGSGRFIMENGTIDGDPVFETEYINTKTDGTQDSTEHLGMGVFSYLAANQHGQVRLVVDPYSMAAKGMVKITLNTRWSETTLREQAFAIYALA